MAITIIIQDDDVNQGETLTLSFECDDEDWEEECYQLGCKVAKKVAIRVLEAMEEKLFQQRPKDWKVEDTKKRTRVTRFGEIPVWRRLYKDAEGNYHFLLDEYLNWPPYKRATPSLTEALIELSTKATFREVGKTLEKLTAGVLSKSTIHRMLQEVSEAAIEGEKKEWEACFQEGKSPPPGERKTRVLYTEADGLHVHLQREGKQKHYELKNAIAYEGWERLPQKEERYGVVGKRVYCHGDPQIPFWDGASLVWHKWWDLGYTNLIVLGGDDALWIDKGEKELAMCVRNLSGFHLSRSCRRGWKNGGEVYDAIRSGRVHELIVNPVQRSGKTAKKNRQYALKRLEKGMDWRKKIQGTSLASIVPEDARGLGAIEGNESHLFADRMKDRGMSWTIKGAQHMGKAIQLVANGELKKWCVGKTSQPQRSAFSFDLFEAQSGYGQRASLPALAGPHAARPWARVLKNLTTSYYPLN